MLAAAETIPTISSAIAKLHEILSDNGGKDSVYGRGANGSLPIVVHVDNKVSPCPSNFNTYGVHW